MIDFDIQTPTAVLQYFPEGACMEPGILVLYSGGLSRTGIQRILFEQYRMVRKRSLNRGGGIDEV